MICLLVKTEEEMELVQKLACEIWKEHYSAILSQEQIDYMTKRFQSAEAIQNQISSEGYTYYFLMDGEQRAGYLAIRRTEGKLFLSKLYLKKEHRGKRLSSRALAFLEELCREEKLFSVWLTVNRRNANSIAVYQKLGFRIVRTQVTDIGNGFVTDDYIMEKIIR